jgi:dCMP deaminase
LQYVQRAANLSGAPGMRPDFDEYYMDIAQAVAKRGDCTRRQVGAVIVDLENRIVSTGYNGTPPGGPSCLKGDCPRGRHYEVQVDSAIWYDKVLDKHIEWPVYGCACRKPWPCPDTVAPDSSYDTGPGACISTHAEANALLYADYDRRKGGTMYITEKPCDGCMKLIKSALIECVIWEWRNE